MLGDLDSWITQLYDCKPLAEEQLKVLCEKVRALGNIPCERRF
jgi:hypothetical protein